MVDDERQRESIAVDDELAQTHRQWLQHQELRFSQEITLMTSPSAFTPRSTREIEHRELPSTRDKILRQLDHVERLLHTSVPIVSCFGQPFVDVPDERFATAELTQAFKTLQQTLTSFPSTATLWYTATTAKTHSHLLLTRDIPPTHRFTKSFPQQSKLSSAHPSRLTRKVNDQPCITVASTSARFYSGYLTSQQR